MEVPAHQSNLRTNQEDERIELDDLLHTTTKNTESDETMPTKQTGEAESASVVEVPVTTEVDPELHAENDCDGGDERIELHDLLHTTTKNTESDETMPTKQTGEAESASVVEVTITTEVDSELHDEKDCDGGDSDDRSCCTCSK